MKFSHSILLLLSFLVLYSCSSSAPFSISSEKIKTSEISSARILYKDLFIEKDRVFKNRQMDEIKPGLVNSLDSMFIATFQTLNINLDTLSQSSLSEAENETIEESFDDLSNHYSKEKVRKKGLFDKGIETDFSYLEKKLGARYFVVYEVYGCDGNCSSGFVPYYPHQNVILPPVPNFSRKTPLTTIQHSKRITKSSVLDQTSLEIFLFDALNSSLLWYYLIPTNFNPKEIDYESIGKSILHAFKYGIEADPSTFIKLSEKIGTRVSVTLNNEEHISGLMDSYNYSSVKIKPPDDSVTSIPFTEINDIKSFKPPQKLLYPIKLNF